MVKESRNLIGWEHFGPSLANQIFARCGIWRGKQQIKSFILGYFQQKNNYKILRKLKNSTLGTFCSF